MWGSRILILCPMKNGDECGMLWMSLSDLMYKWR